MKQEKETMLLKPKDAANQLAISQRTLWQLTKDGQIPYVKIKGMVRYDQQDITTYINSKKITKLT